MFHVEQSRLLRFQNSVHDLHISFRQRILANIIRLALQIATPIQQLSPQPPRKHLETKLARRYNLNHAIREQIAVKKRLHIFYTGTVQGVGFRFTVRRIASRLPVTGFVRNLSDGRVELLAEGDEQDLGTLSAEINHAMRRYVTNANTSWSDATGDFDDFTIRFF
jgi:acylphosphatase